MPKFIVVCPLALLILPSITLAQASFQGLGDLPGGTVDSRPYGMSHDGRAVVGYSQSTAGLQAFRWTQSTGIQGLGDLPGGPSYSWAYAANQDGSVVVGVSQSAAGFEAFRWIAATNTMTGLGDLNGGSFSSRATSVSCDGNTVVGVSSSINGSSEAFLWTSGTATMTGLGDLAGGPFSSRAEGVSCDGSTVVGYSYSSLSPSEAFRAVLPSPMAGIGDLPPLPSNSTARGVSATGEFVVGRGTGPNDFEGFVWTEAQGYLPLGGIENGFIRSSAAAVSDDGQVVVGGGTKSGSVNVATIWTAQSGMRSIKEVLLERGVAAVQNWDLTDGTGVSGDGTRMTGFGRNPSGQFEAWLAVLPRACPGDANADGAVDLLDLLAFTSAWSEFLGQAVTAGSPGDYNSNGAIDLLDLLAFNADWSANLGTSCP